MVWPLLTMLGSGGAAAGGAGAGAAGGAMGGLGGLLGGGGLLGKNGKASKWKDAAGNAASKPGEPGMPLRTGEGNFHMHAPDLSMVGQGLLFKLADQASKGTRQGPGQRRRLPADFMGLLGGL